jgi:hypothetical protein
MNPEMVMYEREFQQIQGVCSRLHRDSNASAVLLIDKKRSADRGCW